MPTKRCKSGKRRNPATRRCIKSNGALARKLGLVSRRKAPKTKARKVSRKASKRSGARKGSRKASRKASKRKSRKGSKAITRSLTSAAIKKFIKYHLLTGNPTFPKSIAKKYNLDPNNEELGLFMQYEIVNPKAAAKMAREDEVRHEKAMKAYAKLKKDLVKRAGLSEARANQVAENAWVAHHKKIRPTH